MAGNKVAVNADLDMQRRSADVSLLQWIGGKFICIFLSAVIFFLAGLLVMMTFFPKAYESEAGIYVSAVSGNTNVGVSALGDVLRESASGELTEGLAGFDHIPASWRIRINDDPEEGSLRVRAASEDPYASFDAVRRAIDVLKKYLADNEAPDAIRIVKYPEIARHWSYAFLCIPALFAALAGAVLAFFLTIVSYGSYKRAYLSELEMQEQAATSTYAAFEPESGKSDFSGRMLSDQDELMRSLAEQVGQPNNKTVDENLWKIMSAKDPKDESGRIVIPDYHEGLYSLEEDDVVNFLQIGQDDEPDVSIEDEFDEDAQEEDLARLFGDQAEDTDDLSDEEKGGM